MKLLTIILGTDNGKMRVVARQVAPLKGLGHYALFYWPELRYDQTVEPLSDARVAALADELIFSAQVRGRHVVVTHSEVFVTRVRRRVAEGTLKADDVEVLWVKEDGTADVLEVDEYGRISIAQVSPFKTCAADSEAIIRAALARRKSVEVDKPVVEPPPVTSASSSISASRVYEHWRADEPVDGAGLPLQAHAAAVVRGISSESAGALAAELRNALVPMQWAVSGRVDKEFERLHALADALAARGDTP